MPYSADERLENLTELCHQMDRHGIPQGDRFLDALVFPVGAGPEYGAHYLEAVKLVRGRFPEAHVFGGHSNVSFGLPNRKTLNAAFVILSVLAGCDAIMVDPVMNPPRDFLEFKLAADALTGRDEFAESYLAHYRRSSRPDAREA